MVDQPNYTQIPNQFLDDRMAKLSGSAFKVLMTICRKTFGFHKEQLRDMISDSQLMAVTGLASKQTLYNAFKELGEDVKKTVISGHSFYEVNVSPSMQQWYGGTEIVPERYENRTTTGTEIVHTKETKQIRHPHSRKDLPNFDWDTTQWENIPDDLVELWQKAYPDVNIEQELIAMGSWLKMNPDRAPKSRYGRFICGWLYRKQNGWSKT